MMAKIVEYAGKKLSIAAHARRFGLSPQTVRDRLHKGWSLRDALLTCPKKGRKIVALGQTKTVKEWAREVGITPGQMGYRLQRKDMTPEEAVTLARGERLYYTSRERVYAWQGEEMCISELARAAGLHRAALDSRLRKGWTLERAMTEPSQGRTRLRRWRGKDMTLAELSAESGLSKKTLGSRLSHGWSLKRAMTTPLQTQYQRPKRKRGGAK